MVAFVTFFEESSLCRWPDVCSKMYTSLFQKIFLKLCTPGREVHECD